MYYPKSQIKTNLRTQGNKFSLSGTGEEYQGYYYITSNGQAYSGKTPSDPTSKLLLPNDQNPLNISSQTDAEASVPNLTSSPPLTFYTLPSEYVNSSKIDVFITPPLPKQSYPIVTENDYKLGEFQRYFLKKGNESIFIEISLENYRKYISRDRDAMHELYIPIQINWVLTGEKEQVYKVNQNIVAKAEREQNLPGFTQYFRDKFTQFYR